MLLIRLVICSALWLVADGHSFNLDSLLVKSVGGPAAAATLREMTSYTAEGSVSINGNLGTFRQVFVPPQKLYLEVNLGDLKLIQAYDGKTGWQRDHNGSITILQGLEREELLEQIFFESYAYLFPDRMAGQMAYRGDTIYQEMDAHVMVIAPPGVDSVTVYFDRATGFRRYMVSRMDNTEVITTISDYRDVQGIQVPFRSNAMSVGAPIYSEFQITNAQFNVSVDTNIFRRPDSQAVDFHFPSDRDQVRIPFEFRNGHVYVPVTINGTARLLLILDSGASANLLHARAVTELNLPEIGTVPAKGLADYEEVKLVRVDSLAVGELRLYNQVSGLFDLSGVGSNGTGGGEFGGILGYDFLSRFPAMLDYADSVLVVFNPDRFEAPVGGIEIPFHLTMQVPTVTVTVNDVPGEFIVDLGNAFGLILHKGFANRPEVAKTLRSVDDYSSSLGGVGGGVAGKAATVDSVVIGGQIRLADMRVICMESAGGLAGSERLSGNIGNQVLQRYRVLFDYTHQRLFFYPADTNP